MPVKPIVLMLLGFLFFQAGHGQAPKRYFEVKVNGAPLELHEFKGETYEGAFGQFDMLRPVDVEIRSDFDVRWVQVRPKSAGIVPTIGPDHSTVRFQVKSPVPLTVEFNGYYVRVLHLFANPPENDPPKPDAPHVRYFGPGLHEPGLIELKDGETLYLAPGAWVRGQVRSIGTKNIAIRGRGVLDGTNVPHTVRQNPAGYVWNRENARPPSASAPGEASAPPPPAKVPYNTGLGARNMIYLERTVGAKLEGVTIFNHVGWTIILRATNDTHVDGIRILNATDTCGTDGIDIVAGSGVLVENAFVRTNDDCVAVKSLSEQDGEVHDITVRHSVIWDRFCGNALEIGFELRAPKIERIRFEDIDVIRVEDHGSPISIHNGDSGTVQDVTYNNIRVEEAQHKLMDFSVVHGRYGVDRPVPDLRLVDLGEAWRGVLRETAAEKAASAQARGQIRNIRVTNLQVVDGKLPFSIISGYDKEHSVDNVQIEGLKYLGRPIRNAAEGKFSIENAPGFQILP